MHLVPCLRSNRSRLGSRYTFVRIIFGWYYFPPPFPVVRTCARARVCVQGWFWYVARWLPLTIVRIHSTLVDTRVLDVRTIKLNTTRWEKSRKGPFEVGPVWVYKSTPVPCVLTSNYDLAYDEKTQTVASGFKVPNYRVRSVDNQFDFFHVPFRPPPPSPTDSDVAVVAAHASAVVICLGRVYQLLYSVSRIIWI